MATKEYFSTRIETKSDNGVNISPGTSSLNFKTRDIFGESVIESNA